MAADTAEVVIVGGGLEGAAAAWQLTRRGITDVLGLERATVGSGMTGKSSGIVRCHYGVSALAAMASDSLVTFENAQEIFGADIGFRNIGYVVGVGEVNVANFRRSLEAQRAVGVQTEKMDKAEVAKMWPWADLEPFAAFAWEQAVRAGERLDCQGRHRDRGRTGRRQRDLGADRGRRNRRMDQAVPRPARYRCADSGAP